MDLRPAARPGGDRMTTAATLPPLLRQQLVEACQRLAAGPGLPTEADVLDEMAQPNNFHVGVALYRAHLTSTGDDFGLAVDEVADLSANVDFGSPPVDHDGPCAAPRLGPGECDACADVRRALLDDALDRLVGLIGDATVDRMRRAVAA